MSASIGTNRSRQALADYAWPREHQVVHRGRWQLYACDLLDYLAAWVDVENTRIAISHDTWETLSYDETAIAAFFTDMTGGATGMKFVVTEAGPYAAAVRKQSADMGAVAEQDAVAALITSANNLVLQASSMNRQPTPNQQRLFAERYVALCADADRLESRLALARAALELAGSALADVVTR